MRLVTLRKNFVIKHRRDPDLEIKIRENIIASLHRFGFLTKTKFISFLQRTNKLFPFDSSLVTNSSFSLQIDRLITILKKRYGKNWDFYLRQESVDGSLYSLWLKIYYPEVTIKNSQGDKHTMKGVVILIKIKRNNNYDIKFGDILLTRTHLTSEENNIGYFHSHVETGAISTDIQPLYGRSFCLPSSIRTVRDRISTANNFVIENYELFFSVLDNMVKWESLEGSPYIRMSNIQGSTSTFSPLTMNNINTIANQIYSYVDPQCFNVTVQNGGYAVIIDKYFVDYIKTVLIENYSEYLESILFIYDSEGVKRGYPKNSKNLSGSHGPKTILKAWDYPYIYLQGRKIPFKIRYPEKRLPDPHKYHISVPLLDAIKKKIEYELYKSTAIRRVTTRVYQSTT